MLAVPPLIAVLDDDARMRTALRRLLTVHGFRVEEFERGEDFLATPPSHAMACLVLDLHMDGLSGFDVLAAFRPRLAATPVVIITGHDEPGTESRVRSLGASSFLTKPVDESVLLDHIRSAISSTHPEFQNPSTKP